MPSTLTVKIPLADREVLTSWTRSPSVRTGLAQRAHIVLLAGQGVGTGEIARLAGVSTPTVITWKRRYAEEGLDGLADRHKPGGPRRTDDVAIVLTTLEHPPARLGATRWSARLLGAELGIPFTTVARIWRKWDLRPWGVGSFTFPTDPGLDARIAEVVGIYLNPPTNAIVVRIDENARIEALDRAAPIRSIRPGAPQEQAPDDPRNGITALLAAMRLAAGRATDPDDPGARDTGPAIFLEQIAKTRDPGVELHIVADNRDAGRHPAVAAWLSGNPWVTMHFTTTAGSWLNLVEIFFGVLARRTIGRAGTVDAVDDLTKTIRAFVDGRNEHRQPFIWTKDAGPSTAPTAVEQLPERDPSILDLSRTTGELAAAIQALCTRLDMLEAAIGEVGACRAPVTDLTAAIAALRARLDAVESPSGGAHTSSTGRVMTAEADRDAVLGADVRGEVMTKTSGSWLLDRLELNTGPLYTRGNVSGSLAFGGIVRMPGSGEVKWQGEYTVPDVMACDLRAAAVVLAALGHPLRLELLRKMLLGASTVGQLQEIDGVGTAGQVQHHLRELRAAGLVVSHRRNHYAIPPDRVVPLLLIVALALARRVYGSAGSDPVGDEELSRHSLDSGVRPALPTTKYWVLDHLARNTGPRYTRGDISGSIAYGGIARASDSFNVRWSGQFTVPDIAASDLPAAAVVLAALGHPVRLLLLRRMLRGAHTVGEFQKIDGIVGSTGQVHHHLRELRVAEHVLSGTRNNYSVPLYRIVPFLVIVAASVGRRVFAAAGRDPDVDEL